MIPRLPQEIRRPDATTIAMLRESRDVIAARPVDLSAAVYRHLPTFAPRTRELIAAEIRLHGERIVFELLRAVEALDAIALLEADLHRLGAEHAGRHGVPAEHYPYLGQALVRAVRELFPGSDGGTLGSAWMEVYEWLAAQMLHGAVASVPSYSPPPRQREATSSPAYWRAYVDAETLDPLGSDVGGRVDPALDRTEFLDRDRVELFERLARAEDVGASPDVRGQRALLPAEPTLPVAVERRLSLHELPRPGSGSPWPQRAGQVTPPSADAAGAGTNPTESDFRGTAVPEPTAIGRAHPTGPPAAPTWVEPRSARGMGTGWPPDPAIKPPRPPRPGQPDLDDAPVQE